MQLKLDHTAFEKEIEERGIEYLIHFTPTINLMGIFEQGKLLSRALLEEFDVAQTDIRDYVEFTDDIDLMIRITSISQYSTLIRFCLIALEKKQQMKAIFIGVF